MKKILGLALVSMCIATAAMAQTMVASPNGSRPSMPGSSEWFTGTVTVTPLFAPTDDTNAGAGLVEFTPGARSHWHTHPAGQILIVTSGTGWVQQEGGDKIVLKPGDVITTPKGVKHWHGATAANGMSHIAVSPVLDGKNVEWLEPVSDDQYL